MIPVILALAVIVILLVVFIAGQPDEFKVSRSAKIPALPEMVFPLVTALQAWEAWSPWAKLDPNAKNNYVGPASGVGAAMRWEGNNKVGVGTMTITESKPSETIRFRLVFEKPMQATNAAEFTFKLEDGQTLVTWTMSGKNSLGGKIFGLLMNCEKMVGGQFEQGLANLKSVVETAGRK